MKTNKMLSDSSISKVWENFRKMNGIVLTFPSANWVKQSDGTFTNTVEYDGFTSDDILEVDLYDDGNLTETQISEYDGYITEFNVEDGKIVAVATTKPTQLIKILARGEIVGKMVVNSGDSSDITASNVSCLDKDGKTSNVQKELDEQNKKFDKRYDYLKKEKITTLDTVNGTYTVSKNGKIIIYFAGVLNGMVDYLFKFNDILMGSRGVTSNDRYIWSTELTVQVGDVISVQKCSGLYETQNYFIPYE